METKYKHTVMGENKKIGKENTRKKDENLKSLAKTL